jgi:glycosyltransferase involved in cell wall biosynthesis
MSSSVSVALCTYNGARFIDEQLRSILSQSLLPAEIVVADDGSTDGTVDRVSAIAAEAIAAGQNVDIRILDGLGGSGVTKNFERAISACRSELIALSDQDDVWLPGRLALQVAQFDSRPDLTLLFGDARLVDANGQPLGVRLLETLEVGEAVRNDVHAGGAFAVLLRRNIVTGATLIFRRSLLGAALPLPPEWVHDEWLAILAAAIGTVDLIEDEVTDYRQHGNNQIGVRAPTLRNKIDRVLQPRGSRNADLAVRSDLLRERLEIVAKKNGALIASARGKSGFETFRAHLHRNRLRRVIPVLRRAVSGDYEAFASQGRADIVRDLLQPA